MMNLGGGGIDICVNLLTSIISFVWCIVVAVVIQRYGWITIAKCCIVFMDFNCLGVRNTYDICLALLRSLLNTFSLTDSTVCGSCKVNLDVEVCVEKYLNTFYLSYIGYFHEFRKEESLLQ